MRLYMKKSFVVPVFLMLFAACFNPLLDWIDSPIEPSVMSASDKEILSFSFGLKDETDVIRLEPRGGGEGKTPITVILPFGNDKSNLSPTVTFTGKALAPPSGQPQNFNHPVTYRVTAEDNSWREYEAEVIVKTRQSAEIIWFDLELPKADSHLLAEGVVNENEVIIHVPNATDLGSLTAKIIQTGSSLTAPNAFNTQTFSGTAISLTGDFSRPVTYTVKAEDGTSRKYDIIVIRDKSDAREITAFSFAEPQSGEPALIGWVSQPDGKFPIVVTVPPGTNLNALTPVITHTGYSIEGSGVSSIGGGPGTITGTNQVNFSRPVSYTVRAEDGNIREYTVTVLISDRNSSKQITGFYFLFPNAQGQEGSAGIINETAKTIALTVPSGTNLRYLAPVIYHTGASVNPLDGEPQDFSNSGVNPVPYTVTARDGTRQTYMVSVYAKASGDKAITAFEFAGIAGETTVIGSVPSAKNGKTPIVVTVPAYTDATNSSPVNIAALNPEITYIGYSLTGPGVSSTGGPATVSGTGVNFTAAVPYTVHAEDGTVRDYEVIVIQLGSAASGPAIDFFYFNNPLVVGEINQTDKTITATVPWDTNLTTLTPTIHFSGNGIVQSSSPYSGPRMENPAHIGADFSYNAGVPKNVPYTVTASSGSSLTYQVKVSLADKPKSSAREITALTFAGIDPAKTTTVIASTQNAGRFPIMVSVPPGTDLSALRPAITHTGVSISGAGVSGPGPGTVQAAGPVNFNDPVPYTVTAEDGQTRDYLVTVQTEDNNIKEIVGFYFANPVAVGVIDQSSHTITVKVPYETDLLHLVPTVYYNGVSLEPASGIMHDFSATATYKVKARNNTVQPYTVKVLAGLNTAKEITVFSFPDVGVLETVIGSIPGADRKIPISVTVSPSTVLSSLKPQITHTGQSITPPGGTAQTSPNPYNDISRNFSGPQTYRITAEDGSFKDYAVSVHVSNDSSKVITGFVFNSVPAVGSIDQNARTIDVVIPHSAASSISGLAPSITYIGASITPQAGLPQTANPFTDSAQNFSGPRDYTVTAVDGSSQTYTVSVSVAEQNLGLVDNFIGITDPDLITTSFDQSTGILTLTLAAGTGYTAPYEWYLNGQKLNVSGTEPRLSLHTGGLQPGQHEIVVVVTKSNAASGYPSHYTNKVYFMVHE
jgi:hypothetical protein